MKMVPKNLTVEIKHSWDALGRRRVCLCACDSLGRVHYSRTYLYDPHTDTWHFAEDGGFTEVAQERVFMDFVNAYRSMMSVENLISENLTAVEEDLYDRDK